MSAGDNVVIDNDLRHGSTGIEVVMFESGVVRDNLVARNVILDTSDTGILVDAIASSASNRARAFSVGDSIVELISAGSAPGGATAHGIDHIRVTVKDSAESIRRTLRERGIATADGATPGAARIADPDGIGIELAPT